MRRDDISEYLIHAANELADLRKREIEASNDPSIAHLSRPQVQHIASCIHSALEFSNMDLWEALEKERVKLNLKVKKNKQLNYWNCKDSASFVEWIYQYLRYIDKIFPDVYNHMKSIHQFESGDNWFGLIKEMNNTQKHEKLLPHKRTDTINANIGDGGIFIEDVDSVENITITNSSFGGRHQGSSIFINNGQIKRGAEALGIQSLPVVLIKNSKFFYSGVHITEFLQSSIEKTDKYVTRFYELLDRYETSL